ncbi:MAG: hypothetical protein WCG98_10725 [bacterium]
MDNALQSFSDQIANAVKPENLLASIITNMAFIGGLKLYSNVLMSPLVGRIINARANTKVENGIKESIKKSEQINIELKRLEVEE